MWSASSFGACIVVVFDAQCSLKRERYARQMKSNGRSGDGFGGKRVEETRKARSNTDGPPHRTIRLLRVAYHQAKIGASLFAFAHQSIVRPDALCEVAIWQDK